MWIAKFSKDATKQLKKIDRKDAVRLVEELKDIAASGNPRSKGKALTGNLKGLWRYRVGDYRAICEIRDDELVILAVKIAHRREAYR